VVERLQAAMREKEETEEELRTVSAASNRNEKLVNKLQRDLLRLRGLSEDLRAQLRTADAKLTASRAREKKLQTQRDDLNAKLEQINRAAHDQQWKAVSELMARLPSA
jgi:chromosome segregation ATPase